MKMKRCLSMILSAVMVLTVAVSDPVFAEKTDQKEIVYAENEEYTESLEDVLEELPENDELFEGYVNELFYGSYGVTTFGNYAKDRLDEVSLNIYNKLKENIQKIASGEVSGTKMEMAPESVGITKTVWTAQELGVSSVMELVEENGVEKWAISDEAMAAWREQNAPDLNMLLNYLLIDCPLDLYWYNKTAGTSIGVSYGASGYRGDEKNWSLTINSVVGQFPVAQGYQDANASDPAYTVANARVLTAKRAADNAKAIVEKYEKYSDYRKLEVYSQEICDLVNYNTPASDDSTKTPYGDPWQLIWVFDGDESTDVVCEGYSKAFQYLCDMSNFVKNISCYTVTGTMGGGEGAGAHMWNIVTMDNGKSYLVDITNCDEGTIGAGNQLFLVGAKYDAADQYTVTLPGGKIVYRYDDVTKGMYGTILNIASSDYEIEDIEEGSFEGEDGNKIGWKLSENGCLTIEGSGKMGEIAADTEEAVKEAIPWLKHQVNISKIVVEEGITEITMYVFAYTKNLKEVTLPSTLNSIGQDAFADSSVEEVILPEGLEMIAARAFTGCKNLKEITIPASVEKIGSEAFKGCTSLTDIRFLDKSPCFIEYMQGETKLDHAFAGDTLRVHYPKAMEETETRYAYQYQDEEGNTQTIPCTWKSTRETKFANAENITWIAYCAENEHDWGTQMVVDKPATCTETGSQSIHCQICGEFKDSEEIPTIPHTYGDWTVVQSPTCTGAGIRKRICSVCGEENIQEFDSLGHTWSSDYTTDTLPTCTSPGSKSKHCSVCDEKDPESVTAIPVVDHTLTKQTSPNGDYYLCSVCSKTFSDAEGTKEITVNNKILVDRISISAISTKIAAGKKVTLQAEVLPVNASDKKLTWESSNPSYATVINGVVTTKKAGAGNTVTITAKAADGSGKSASITIMLMKDAVKKVTIQNAQKRLKAGRSMKLKTKITGSGKKLNKTIKWTSSNEKYATVTSKGVVKAMPAGKGKTVKITAMATDGSNKKATVKIKIN